MEHATREKLLNLIADTYSSPNDSWGYNHLPEVEVKEENPFYQAMKGKIQTLLDSPSRALTDEQKEYWGGMADKVGIPLQYG